MASVLKIQRPASKRKLVEGWPLETIIFHLEAITFGDINPLLINVPPGFMKSLMLNVFWPAWEWGPMNMPYLRHLAFSYAQDLTTRDNNKLVKLVTSPQFQALWGDRFTMVKIGEHRPENDKTGFILATSVTGVSTGERGDRVRLVSVDTAFAEKEENDPMVTSRGCCPGHRPIGCESVAGQGRSRRED
jgi:hypothetical protein